VHALQNKAERRLSEDRPQPSDLIARNLHAGLRLGEPADLNLKVSKSRRRLCLCACACVYVRVCKGICVVLCLPSNWHLAQVIGPFLK